MGHGQGGAFDIGVVGQHVTGDRSTVFEHRSRVGNDRWRVIDRRERDLELSRGGDRRGVNERVGDFWQRAVPVGHWREGIGAGGGDGQRTHAGDGSRLACGERTRDAGDRELRDRGGRIGEGVVGADIAREDDVFGADHHIIDGAEVDHVERERGRRGQGTIGERVGSDRDIT